MKTFIPNILNTIRKANKVFIILFMLLALPLTLFTVQQVSNYLTKATAGTVAVSFSPSQSTLPPDRQFDIMLNSGTTKVAFARVVYTFDRTKVQLRNEIQITGVLTTVVEKTSMSTANAQGRAVVVVGLPPNTTYPTGVFKIATFTLGSVATTSTTGQLNFVATDMQIVEEAGSAMVITATSASLTLSSSNVTPTLQAPTLTPTRTPTVTLTPTRTPTQTPTRTPTPSQPVPTNTPLPNSTQVGVTLLLHGIGSGGDNASPTSGGNTNPLRTQRNVTIEIYNGQNQLILTKDGFINYQSTSGNFTGTVDLGTTLSTGSYLVRIKSPQYLRQLVPAIVSLSAGSTTTIPSVTLVTGDMDSNNTLNILDFNILLDCYSDLSPAKNCADTAKRTMADITDDGAVNLFDLNLFIRELSVQSGV